MPLLRSSRGISIRVAINIIEILGFTFRQVRKRRNELRDYERIFANDTIVWTISSVRTSDQVLDLFCKHSYISEFC